MALGNCPSPMLKLGLSKSPRLLWNACTNMVTELVELRFCVFRLIVTGFAFFLWENCTIPEIWGNHCKRDVCENISRIREYCERLSDLLLTDRRSTRLWVRFSVEVSTKSKNSILKFVSGCMLCQVVFKSLCKDLHIKNLPPLKDVLFRFTWFLFNC